MMLWTLISDRFLAEHERGASLIEYTLLVSFIAIICIGGVAAVGGLPSPSLSMLTSSLNE